MTTTTTYDSAALALLLSGAHVGGPRLRALADRAAGRGIACPECGSTADHDDNGEAPGSYFFALNCSDCGTHWEPNA